MSKQFFILSLIIASIAIPATAADYKEGELLVRFSQANLEQSVSTPRIVFPLSGYSSTVGFRIVQPQVTGPMTRLAVKNAINKSIMPGAIVAREYEKTSPGLTLVELPPGKKVIDALFEYIISDNTVYAQPNYRYQKSRDINPNTPDDPRFWRLWGLENTDDTDIDATEAWSISSGIEADYVPLDPSNPDENLQEPNVPYFITVAVTDTGVDYRHPELKPNMWINLSEYNGTDGVDDDENGYIDDIYGYDFAGAVSLDIYDGDGDPLDYDFHGTHVAGTIGARGNNGTGIAGVCWSVKIMALKIFADDSPYLFDNDAIEAIEYSIAMDANVINASWGGSNYSQALKDTIEAAGNAGVLFVAAAGNDGFDNDSAPAYPASYDLDNIISVMSSDHFDTRSNFSNFGETSVDLAAPGSEIYSTTPTEATDGMTADNIALNYDYLNGTSMASPHVAGACALVWAVDPNLTSQDVKDIILHSVDRLDSMNGLNASSGRLNLYNALNIADSNGKVRNITATDNLLLEATADPVFSSIQDAIDAAADGDILVVDTNSWYTETIDLGAKNLDIHSGDANVSARFFSTSRQTTYISGLFDDTNDVVTIAGDQDGNTVLEGFTILGGSGSGIYIDANVVSTKANITDCIISENSGHNGSGIYCSNSEPNITDCLITRNIAEADGGGIYLMNSAAKMTNCQIVENKVIGFGGGVYIDTDFDSNTVTDITNCTIEDNIADYDGGGIFCSNAEPNIIGTTISDNNSLMEGGGIYCTTNSKPQIENCNISNNTSAYEGGGLNLTNSSDANVIRCDITGNRSGWEGGGIYCNDSDPNIFDCTISNNLTEWDGGGLYCGSGSQANIQNNIITNNRSFYGGAGIYVSYANPLIKNNLINFNLADGWDGGGVYLTNSSVDITNCTFVGNDTKDNLTKGGAIFCENSSSTNVTNCIFTDNNDIAIYEYDAGSNANVTYCMFYENPDGDYQDDGTLFDFVGIDGSGNHGGFDPMFVKGRLGDYYLSNYQAGQQLDSNGTFVTNPSDANSPAIDKGSDTAANLGLGADDPNYSTRTDIEADIGQVDIGFHYRDAQPIQIYSVIVTIGTGQGDYTLDPNYGTYKQYAHVRVISQPDTDYQFDSWEGLDWTVDFGQPNEPTVVITVNSDRSLVINFLTVLIELRARVSEGSGTIDPRRGFYPRGSIVDLTATPINPSNAIIWQGTDDDHSTLQANIVTLEPPFTGSNNNIKEVSVIFYAPRSLHVPGDYTYIQDAINDAQDRDIVMLAPGEYLRDLARLTINGKAITLTSANPDDPEVVANTVLRNGITIIDCGRDTIINGLTFRNIGYYGGDGCDGSTDCNPLADGMNGFPAAGAGLRLHYYYWYPDSPSQGSSPDVRNCVFENLTVTGGNGGNGATGGDGGWGSWAHGGAVSIGADSNPRFSNCQFINCSARGGHGGNGGGDPPSRGGLWNQTDLGTSGWDYGPYEDYRKYSGYGGAVYIDERSTPEFIDCNFTNNYTYGGSSGIGTSPAPPGQHYRIDRFGGAIYAADESAAIFTGCNFTNNQADVNGPATHPDGTATANRDADIYIGMGGAVAFEDDAQPFFDDCTFNGNFASLGGAMHYTWAQPIIEDCNFINNQALHGGALLYVGGFTDIIRSEFTGNKALPDIAFYDPNILETVLGQGGAICSLGSNVYIADSQITQNDTSGSGGGIYISGKDITGEEINNNAPITLHNCLIVNNLSDRDGGGVSVNWYSEPNIILCTIADNTVREQGGFGGGLYCSYGSYSDVLDSIIWGNTAVNGSQLAIGSGDPYDPRPSTVDVSYSDVEGSQSGAYIENGCVLNWGLGNLFLDPNFIAGPLDNYYLAQADVNDPNQTVDSPCVDAGSDIASTLGMHLYSTRTDEVPDRNIVDMGYHRPFSPVMEQCKFCDIINDGIINFKDFASFSMWYPGSNCSEVNNWCDGADFTFDSFVNLSDLLYFVECWLVNDGAAPISNPTEWKIVPYSTSITSVGMVAKEATDAWGWDVQYYFHCVYGNCNDSGWQDEPNYVDTSLDPNTEYGYRVRVKDGKCGDGSDINCSFDLNDPNDPNAPNKTGWSDIAYTITNSQGGSPVDFNAPVPDQMTWATPPTEVDANSITMTATTATDPEGSDVEYYFDEVSDGNGATDSGWQDSTTYVDTGLDPNTQYCYRVKARDKSPNYNETAYSTTGCATTLGEGEEPETDPPTPNPSQWATYPYSYNDGGDWYHQMAAVEATDESLPVQYYFESTNGGPDSGWQTNSTYIAGPFGSASPFFYRVRTRDALGNIGSWSTTELTTY